MSIHDEAVRRCDVEELMAALGEDEFAVAETLREGGYKGEVGCSGRCPVARYLQDKTGEEYWDVGMVIAYLGARWAKVPWPVREFIRKFDSGVYPSLEA